MSTDPSVNADIPWAMAGPSGADPVVRHYSHDAWNSVSSTIKLPGQGRRHGRSRADADAQRARRTALVHGGLSHLAPVGAPTGRRRTREWAADIGTHLRLKAGVKQRAKQRAEAVKAHGMDDQARHAGTP
ncbi:MAG: hypothetical protein WKF73_07475 [Nocardioidaceae bacterium]